MNNTQEKIDNLINENNILLFMKGDKFAPQCGFSAKVIEILNHYCSMYKTVNVLEDNNIREGIKEYSKWPTIPQLYVNKEFIGGCDILTEMHQSGDLLDIFNIKIKSSDNIKLEISKSAKSAFGKIISESNEGNTVRLSVDSKNNTNLSFEDKKDKDIQFEYDNFKLIIDPLSSSRITNLKIDFIEDKNSSGFSIINLDQDNIEQIDAAKLKSMIENKEKFELIDVRTTQEYNENNISCARLLENIEDNFFDKLNKNTKLIFQCRSGKRSQNMALKFKEKGFKNIANLKGGILAWDEFNNKSLKIV